MKISRRQTVLLFELISSKKPLTYAFLQNYFGVCRRTIHEDVKRINDVLSENHSIKIRYQNGRGFSLEYSSEESLDLLKNELTTKFSDSWEIENNMAEYYCQIIAYFFTRPALSFKAIKYVGSPPILRSNGNVALYAKFCTCPSADCIAEYSVAPSIS